MQETRLTYLFNRYFDKTASPEEREEFLSLVDQDDNEIEIHKLMETSYKDFKPKHQPFDAAARERMLTAIVETQPIEEYTIHSKWKTLWSRIAAAAVILLVASVGVYFYKSSSPKQETKTLTASNEIKPGKNTATLTLADGRKIVLSDAVNGELAREGGVSIQKTNDGKLIYTVDGKYSGGTSSKTTARLNTITTAAGEQYQVILPDGTLVWLNASSSLEYPSVFIGDNRKVKLTGEGYFEVAKVAKRKMPFIVLSKGQQVQVLGTHFNINSYPDEKSTKTTLLEGSVSVSVINNQRLSSDNVVPAILKPGQQSILMNGKTKIVQVQTDDVVAWKNGYFMFNNESLEDVMRRVSRWYDVDVAYENLSSRKITFFGTVSRFSSISQVLNILEQTGEVKFTIDGKRIIVIGQ